MGGNDPLAKGSPYASNTAWVASGGADGGGYMRLYRPTGTVGDGTYWWRPFSPLTGASNGRGQNDPGAGGTLPLQTYTATDGGSALYNYMDRARPGWYGHADYHNTGAFDGTDFWVQVRVKIDPRRTKAGNVVNGKLLNFSTTRLSYTNQEIVTVSAYPTPAGEGTPNIHAMYDGTYGYLRDKGVGTKNPTNWAYSFGWDTLLYHVTPGHQNTVTGTIVKDTRLEVWAARQGETQYTKIWDVMYDAWFDTPLEYTPNMKNGWNAFICWIYQNGEYNSEFFQCFDQIIFSKSMIPCPQA